MNLSGQTPGASTVDAQIPRGVPLPLEFPSGAGFVLFVYAEERAGLPQLIAAWC